MKTPLLPGLRYGDQGDGTYCNPILFADYSDPDVVAVGEDYYLVASSFNCTPGLPILHSRDLVNWQPAGYAMEAFPDEAYARPQHGKGVWAPAIRHHDGRFWVVFGAPDEGIYVTTAERVEGPWTPLHHMAAGKGLIDPCLFWDDDGSAYLLRAQAASRCNGVNSLLTLHRMAPDASKLLDEGEVIIDGNFHHPIVEGPKLYKRNGYYYIFAPAGGVKGGWQTVFRARNLYGPWEDRVVLVQGTTAINGPHQGAWIETPHGEHWFLHFQDRGAYGRVIHLQPMTWGDDGWPRMGDPNRKMQREPVLQHPLPKTSQPTKPQRLPASDDFPGGQLGPQWQWLANYRPEWATLEQPGLRLTTQGTPGGKAHWLEAGNILTQKPQDPRFAFRVHLQPGFKAEGDRAGIILLSGVCGAIYLEQSAGGLRLVQAVLPSKDAPQPLEQVSIKWHQPEIWLELTMIDGQCWFTYGDGQVFTPLGAAIVPQDAAWMGARLGLFALNPDTAASGGSALVSRVSYDRIP
ncbi:MAG: family 43 glycosylhydrolase [Verrucomicrobiota bacterium JB022]|nr:family 43 glycosylhydrolase [Verrucomicrobiota bacterium JB022]